MKKTFLFLPFILTAFIISACSVQATEKGEYKMISASEAKQIIDTEKGYIILDVRTQEEYDEVHIKDALLIPDYEIQTRAEKELTDKNQQILVYCRSGRRSAIAAKKLIDMGYTNVKDFGGIISWPYEIVTE
ncbi:MAG: rhodanese-like domain-containing protein [Clostridiales bacterium]|nr:MAG: rhodanese-like domain-containing protein [Clostridiales bacterium]